MGTTPSLMGSTLRVQTEPLVEPPRVDVPLPKTQPLWRFALVGLGPLGALALFGLLVAIFQHLS
jgi:hypothetical protein